MKLEKIDHVKITLKDLNKTIDFYTNILGMKLEKFLSSLDNKQIRYAVSFGSQKLIFTKKKSLLNQMHQIHPQDQWISVLFPNIRLMIGFIT